jgi:hypothetical protein
VTTGYDDGLIKIGRSYGMELNIKKNEYINITTTHYR